MCPSHHIVHVHTWIPGKRDSEYRLVWYSCVMTTSGDFCFIFLIPGLNSTCPTLLDHAGPRWTPVYGMLAQDTAWRSQYIHPVFVICIFLFDQSACMAFPALGTCPWVDIWLTLRVGIFPSPAEDCYPKWYVMLWQLPSLVTTGHAAASRPRTITRIEV